MSGDSEPLNRISADLYLLRTSSEFVLKYDRILNYQHQETWIYRKYNRKQIDSFPILSFFPNIVVKSIYNLGIFLPFICPINRFRIFFVRIHLLNRILGKYMTKSWREFNFDNFDWKPVLLQFSANSLHFIRISQTRRCLAKHLHY